MTDGSLIACAVSPWWSLVQELAFHLSFPLRGWGWGGSVNVRKRDGEEKQTWRDIHSLVVQVTGRWNWSWLFTLFLSRCSLTHLNSLLGPRWFSGWLISQVSAAPHQLYCFSLWYAGMSKRAQISKMGPLSAYIFTMMHCTGILGQN